MSYLYRTLPDSLPSFALPRLALDYLPFVLLRLNFTFFCLALPCVTLPYVSLNLP